MKRYPHHETFRIVAVCEEKLELMREYRDELHHLKRSQVFLPPDVFLIFGTHRRHHVVEIHYDVYESVEQSEEGAVTT